MRFSSALCLFALALLGCERSRPASGSAQISGGDIILVTIDTWRADAAGFAGNERVATPFLDALARRGIVFTNAHAHNVVTLPSHANILTGLNPYEHGVRENAGYILDESIETVAERLKAAGYATGAFVAAFPLDARYNLDQGFDTYDDNYGKGRISSDFAIQERSADGVLESAARWWNEQTGKKRFAWIHLYDPHAPYAPPASFADRYRDEPYLGEVAAVDSALAARLAPMIDPSTTIIVTSDHGEALGEHGEATHGLFAYESTLRVPLLVVAPKLAARSESAAVRHIDIAPTILDAAGVDAALPGQSLLASLKPVDTYFEALSANLNRGWAPLTGLIRQGRKYIDLPISELYDLAKDPGEQRNLVASERREASAIRSALRKVQVSPAEGRSISSDEAARLRSLGYISGASSAAITAAEDPKNLVHIDAMIHRVIELHQRGKPVEAIGIAREIVKLQPKMAAGRELLAFVLQEAERVPEAIEALQSLVAAGQASTSAKAQLAKLLTESGRSGEGVALLAPIAVAGEDADVLNAYGIALSESGRESEAAAQFQRALSIDPNNAPAYQNLGISALRRNDPARAEQMLVRALELNPRLPLALTTLGVVYVRRGEVDRAREMWQRAFAADRKQYDALYNLGLLALQRGDREEAARALREFVRIAPRERYAGDIDAAKRALASLG